jgi:hypothetical protein
MATLTDDHSIDLCREEVQRYREAEEVEEQIRQQIEEQIKQQEEEYNETNKTSEESSS